MNKFDELFKISAAKGLVPLPCEIERFCYAGTAKYVEKGFLYFLRRQRRGHGEIIGHSKMVIVLWEVRKGQDIKDFVGEGGND